MAYALGFPKDVTERIYSMRDWTWEKIKRGGKTRSARCFHTDPIDLNTADRDKPLITTFRDMPTFMSGRPYGVMGQPTRGPIRKAYVPSCEEHPDRQWQPMSLEDEVDYNQGRWLGTIDVWRYMGTSRQINGQVFPNWDCVEEFNPTGEEVDALQDKMDSSLSKLFWVCQPCDDEESREMMRRINA